MSNSPQPKYSKPLAAISLIIALLAFVAFIIVNRITAPPYPKPQATTNSATATNAPK
jgi:hypothetical protein